MRLAYQAINAIGSDAKYGIHYENSEFLRVWYSKDRAYGYPNRAIPGLMQRKPWTNEPWSGDSTTEALFETVNTIERRLAVDLSVYRRVFSIVWSRNRKLSARYLELPRSLGGLGLLPWQGWVCDTPYPKLEKFGIKFKVGDDTYTRYIDKYSDIATVSPDEARKLQQMSMISKAGTDDVPGINRTYRQRFNNLIGKIGIVEWTKMDFRNYEVISGILPTDYLRKMNSCVDLTSYEKTTPVSFGEYARHQGYWTKLQELSRVLDIRPIVLMRERSPSFVDALRGMERTGWHRGAAIDWLFGKITGLEIGNLHPSLYHTVECATAKAVSFVFDTLKKRADVNWLISRASSSASKYLLTSTLNKRLFSW